MKKSVVILRMIFKISRGFQSQFSAPTQKEKKSLAKALRRKVRTIN